MSKHKESPANQGKHTKDSPLVDPPIAQDPLPVKTHPSKSLREYLLDGLMIFLAVALGFISENLRGDIIEANRTRIFAQSMIEDLKSDSIELARNIEYITYASSNIDSLLSLFLTRDLNDIPTGKLYWFGLWGGARSFFIPNDATFQQMQSSGSLRYITNKLLLQQIVEYEQMCRLSLMAVQRDANLYSEVRKIRGQIFDYRINMEANGIYQRQKLNPDQEAIERFKYSSPALLSNNRVLFNQYLELVRSRNFEGRLATSNRIFAKSQELISALKNEYNIE